ncbi:GDP-fucose protein O-fucosyltransferase 2 isoform X2 [Fopius arisanus]|uniref:GDP-fucose protein O-fucosyltransferase 2 n=1 Tax=Fopius arisanus TaxID=64838 RepID=A0A9R1U4L6_9HYME|nr:PREDICTED: GDP-fucose protein O-fucosyltransferase 2 isoform X2 [Fopius arisanus]
MLNIKLYLTLILFTEILTIHSEFYNGQHPAEHLNCEKRKYLSNKRYILYDVNPPEGFNLRRDVYVRIAVFLHNLNQEDKAYEWILVLPPWDYKSTNGEITLDRVFVLQTDPKMFETNDFHPRNEITACDQNVIKFQKTGGERFKGHFWGYKNITAKDVQCVLFHGTASNLVQNLEPTQYTTYMFDHMETPLHDSYGSREFWKARRSMRFNSELNAIAREFREKYLNSTDNHDKTVKPVDWRNEKGHRTAIGGPYLAVHWRRGDFLIGRNAYAPTIAKVADQLKEQMVKIGLELIFIATDGKEHEFEELKTHMKGYKLERYIPSKQVKQKFKDGGIAIIDQMICSHARYFIGTHESTFTFRIQEEREIIGFSTETTFNYLCWKDKCSPQSQWKITW